MTEQVWIWAWSVSGQVVSKSMGSTRYKGEGGHRLPIDGGDTALPSEVLGGSGRSRRRADSCQGQLGDLEGCSCTGPSSCICTQTDAHTPGTHVPSSRTHADRAL